MTFFLPIYNCALLVVKKIQALQALLAVKKLRYVLGPVCNTLHVIFCTWVFLSFEKKLVKLYLTMTLWHTKQSRRKATRYERREMYICWFVSCRLSQAARHCTKLRSRLSKHLCTGWRLSSETNFFKLCGLNGQEFWKTAIISSEDIHRKFQLFSRMSH